MALKYILIAKIVCIISPITDWPWYIFLQRCNFMYKFINKPLKHLLSYFLDLFPFFMHRLYTFSDLFDLKIFNKVSKVGLIFWKKRKFVQFSVYKGSFVHKMYSYAIRRCIFYSNDYAVRGLSWVNLM